MTRDQTHGMGIQSPQKQLDPTRQKHQDTRKIGDVIEGKDDTHKCNKNQGSGFDGEEEEEDKEEEKVVTKPLEIMM